MLKNRHVYFILALLILDIMVFYPYLNPNRIPPIGRDYSDNHIAWYYLIKQSWSDGNTYALWNPIFLSGTPLYAKVHGTGPLYPLTWLLLFLPPIAAGNLSIFLSYFLAGVAMYFLVLHLLKDRKGAFIAGMFYMVNGFSMMYIEKGWSEYIRAFWLTPIIFLLVYKAFTSRKWIFFSVLASIALFFQVEGGGANTTLWTMFMLGLFLFYSLFGKNPKRRLFKVLLVGGLFTMLFLALAAVRFLPYNEHNTLTRRGMGGVPQEEAMEWQKLDLVCTKDSYKCIHELVEPGLPKVPRRGFGFKIGIIGLLLAGLAVRYRWKNRFVLFFSVLSILSVLLALGTPLMYIVWKYVPGFASHRYPHRALLLFSFGMSILTGYGAVIMFKLLKRQNIKRWAFLLLSALVIVDLVVLGYHYRPLQDMREIKQDFELYDYLSQQDGLFRVHPINIYGVNRGFLQIALVNDLQFVYGYDPLWSIDYLPIYLSAVNSNPPKMFGMLNTKYITSPGPINRTGLRLVKEFPAPKMAIEENNQTHLYENEMFLPRAYLVKKAVLVVGEKDPVRQTGFAMQLDPRYNPAGSVIINFYGRVSELDQGFINSLDAIVLTQGSLDESSQPKLERYVNQEGFLLPNIIQGKNAIEEGDVEAMWQALSTDISYQDVEALEITDYKSDSFTVKTGGKRGFMVLSEKFVLYDSWQATSGGKELDMYYANGIVTTIRLDGGQEEIMFEYMPDSFRKGALISGITAVIVVLYLLFVLYMKWKSKGNKPDRS
ncbi:MAG: YfhO family protein [Nanoarchaeota archaeon]|nr:YfhO family protein [Nanoarchaeota archaeon]